MIHEIAYIGAEQFGFEFCLWFSETVENSAGLAWAVFVEVFETDRDGFADYAGYMCGDWGVGFEVGDLYRVAAKEGGEEVGRVLFD